MSYPTRRARARARSVRLLVWAVIWPRCSSHPSAPRQPSGPSSVSETAPAPSAINAEPTLALPAPTGPFPVGVRPQFASDATRIDPTTGKPRALPVRVWYPARHVSGVAARYLSPAVQQVAEQVVGVPAGTSMSTPTRRATRRCAAAFAA